MTRFWREGHWRTGPYGSDHWVDGHWVERTDWDRSSYSSAPRHAFAYRPRLTYENFTRPTRCSYCGADVFFVEHNGGRVFFNELCWPWEKHECLGPTITSRSVGSQSAPFQSVTPRRWQQEGWIPIRIDRVFWEDAWCVLKCTQLENEQLVRLLIPIYPGYLRHAPAMLGKWSADGFATISYLDDNMDSQEIIVGKYSEFCLLEPEAVQFPPRPSHF